MRCFNMTILTKEPVVRIVFKNATLNQNRECDNPLRKLGQYNYNMKHVDQKI